jgi:polyhydroxybutyrate depolymerase
MRPTLIGRLASTLGALAVPLCSACGNGTEHAGPSDAASSIDAAAVTDASASSCDAAVKTGDTTVVIRPGAGGNPDGGTRSYLLHVPPSYDGKTALPLIVNFHGLTSNPAQQAAFSGMSPKADGAGYVVAYPEGLQNSWNAGSCCAPASNTKIDDIGFVRAVVADISCKLNIDAKRVYATGMSNGGFLTQRLACEAADLFAAFAPVAGVLLIPPDTCKPLRPIPMIEFHGTADPLVAYDGGGAAGGPSVPDTFAGWAARDGCTDTPMQTFSNGTAHCATYAACKGGVKLTLCTLDGEGHCWPGTAYCPYGNYTTDINADDAMWKFFEGFTLP